MKVAVVGCGYVGLVSGIGLASIGHEVVGIEADQGRRDRISAGTPPFHEPGLRELSALRARARSFRVSPDLGLTAEADVVLLAVQTPADADGAIDLSFLADAASAVSDAFATDPSRQRVVAVRSTVVPGTVITSWPRSSGRRSPWPRTRSSFARARLCRTSCIPTGSSRGCREPWGREALAELYAPFGAPLFLTSPATAELAKYTSNAFLATLVSFSNEIAHVCESLPQVDVEDVLGILHADRRLNVAPTGGRSARDPVLPEGRVRLRRELPAEGPLRPDRRRRAPRAASCHCCARSGRQRSTGRPRGRVRARRPRRPGGREGRGAGLAFKAGTDDLRASPGSGSWTSASTRAPRSTIYDPLVSDPPLDGYRDRGRSRRPRRWRRRWRAPTPASSLRTRDEIAALGELLAGGRYPGLVVVDGRRVLDADRFDDETQLAVGRAHATPLAGDRLVSARP